MNGGLSAKGAHVEAHRPGGASTGGERPKCGVEKVYVMSASRLGVASAETGGEPGGTAPDYWKNRRSPAETRTATRNPGRSSLAPDGAR